MTVPDGGITVDSDLLRVDWEAVAQIYASNQWGQRGGREKILAAFQQTRYVAFAYADGRLIGFGRMLSDGITYGAIYDVVVHAEAQQRGVGTAIMAHLTELGRHLAWITLFAAPGKGGFYRKLGFRTLKTAMLLPKTEFQARNFCADERSPD